VAVWAGPDGVVRPLRFDGAPTLPSAVCAQLDGTLLVGRDACTDAVAVCAGGLQYGRASAPAIRRPLSNATPDRAGLRRARATPLGK
jgi:hypothetical protein